LNFTGRLDNANLLHDYQANMPPRMSANLKNDLRERPSYGIPEAAHYLHIPSSTIRWWVTGRSYHVETGPKKVKPIIEPPDDGVNILSFINLVEIHVLDAIRRKHKIPFPKVHSAVLYLKKHFQSRHPLADSEFQTDGISLFVQQLDELINVSQAGQLAMRQLLESHLQRIDRDPKGIPLRLYPFIRSSGPEEPRVVVIDPYMAFGRPSLKGTRITTSTIAERFRAGESVIELAGDYDRSQTDIEEAIRCELNLEAA
jgi:uncharacterized protein (DUF433 family)